MKSSIFNLLIAGGNSALVTLLFNGRNIGIYHTLWRSELLGFLHEAATAPENEGGWRPRGTSQHWSRSTEAHGELSPWDHGCAHLGQWFPLLESTGPPENWKQAEGGDGWSLQVP